MVKNLTMTIDTLEFAPWPMVKYGILILKFVLRIQVYHFLDFCHGHGQNFDHLTTVI